MDMHEFHGARDTDVTLSLRTNVLRYIKGVTT